MRRLVTAVTLCLAACTSGDRAPQKPHQVSPHQVAPHRVALHVGARSLGDEATWDPVADELVLGLELATLTSTGFGVEFGLLGSTGIDEQAAPENTDITGAVVEAFLGFRQEFRLGRLRPYLGGGGAAVAAAIDNDSSEAIADDEDLSAGFYGHAGLLLDIGSRAYMGVDVRVLSGTQLQFGELEADANYEQVTFMLGMRF